MFAPLEKVKALSDEQHTRAALKEEGACATDLRAAVVLAARGKLNAGLVAQIIAQPQIVKVAWHDQQRVRPAVAGAARHRRGSDE